MRSMRPLSLSIPSAGRQPMKPAWQVYGDAIEKLSIPSAGRQPMKLVRMVVDDAGNYELSIPSAGRQPMKQYLLQLFAPRCSPFNTLCGSSANEAIYLLYRSHYLPVLSIPSAGRQPMKPKNLDKVDQRGPGLSIPSAGRQPMKPNMLLVRAHWLNAFNTLCGSSANEAQQEVDELQSYESFNTLCGSSANEARSRPSWLCKSQGLSIPSAGRQPMKLSDTPHGRGAAGTFNTLCGSSANEALVGASVAILGVTFQYPLRVVSQ